MPDKIVSYCPKVSILMSFGNRSKHLRNALTSWSGLEWEDYEFIFLDNGSSTAVPYYVAQEFGMSIKHYRLLRNDQPKSLNIAWNQMKDIATGEFIIYAMQDMIISSKQIVQKMLDSYEDGHRVSVRCLRTDERMFSMLDSVDWKNNPNLIETLPNFWTADQIGFGPNSLPHNDSLTMYVTGQYRKDWEWMGWFRDDPFGSKMLDCDMSLREKCVKRDATVAKDVVAYHQWHPINVPYYDSPGYIYHTEAQARLLEPAELEPWTPGYVAELEREMHE